MDVDRIRYFNVFAETGSLVRAAEVLHISQPALSKALKLLESEVGIRLVEADGRGLKLTEAGRRLRDETKPLLNEWLTIPKKIRDHDTWKPSRIASFEVFTTYFLGYLINYTDLTSLEVLESPPGRMEQIVAEGKADLAMTYLPVPRAGVEFIEITKIKMGVFGVKAFNSMKFSELPFVVPIHPAEGTPSKVVGLDGWPDHLIDRKIKYRVTMMESAMELCREGHAVAYLPAFVVHLHNKRMLADYRLEEFTCSVPKEHRQQSVYLIRKQGTPESAIERQIAKSLRSLR